MNSKVLLAATLLSQIFSISAQGPSSRSAKIFHLHGSVYNKNHHTFFIDVNQSDCTLGNKVNVYTHMGEERTPYWRPLKDAPKVLTKRITPKNIRKANANEVTFSIPDLGGQDLFTSDEVTAYAEFSKGKCKIRNFVYIDGTRTEISSIYFEFPRIPISPKSMTISFPNGKERKEDL